MFTIKDIYTNEKGGRKMQPSDLVPIYSEIAEVVGVEDAFKLYEHFRGQQMNFPQRIYSTEYVTQYVKTHYDGTNLREFAKQFNYSERRIRQLLQHKNEREGE